jgi:hypothetical protein
LVSGTAGAAASGTAMTCGWGCGCGCGLLGLTGAGFLTAALAGARFAAAGAGGAGRVGGVGAAGGVAGRGGRGGLACAVAGAARDRVASKRTGLCVGGVSFSGKKSATACTISDAATAQASERRCESVCGRGVRQGSIGTLPGAGGLASWTADVRQAGDSAGPTPSKVVVAPASCGLEWLHGLPRSVHHAGRPAGRK